MWCGQNTGSGINETQTQTDVNYSVKKFLLLLSFIIAGCTTHSATEEKKNSAPSVISENTNQIDAVLREVGIDGAVLGEEAISARRLPLVRLEDGGQRSNL